MEQQPEPPRSDAAFASLLHGDGPEYFAYACVLGRRLRDEAGSNSPDRVLLCGPGACTSSASSRKALRQAGWTHLLAVEPMEAEHLDRTKTKRHALVFTKLRVLEVPYDRVLLLDLDLLPRAGVNMAELLKVKAPAGKYHCTAYQGPEPDHGCEIPESLRTWHYWSPNAGVMRLDPLATLECRKKLVATMVQEVPNALRQHISRNSITSPRRCRDGGISPRSGIGKSGRSGKILERPTQLVRRTVRLRGRARVGCTEGGALTGPPQVRTLAFLTPVGPARRHRSTSCT